MRFSFLLALPFLAFANLSNAQESSTTSDVLFILDGSGSMWGRINDVEKIVVAKDVMAGLIDGLPEEIDTGLISYGHRERGSCSDIEVIATPGQTTRNDLLSALSGITPLGKTPISDSLLRAGDVLRDTEETVSIVLVSDGIESCEGDPCATAALLREQGIDVRIHVVGFDVDAEAEEQLRCIAEAGDGEYYQAGSADALTNALADVRVRIVEKPEPAPESVVSVPNLTIADDVLGTVIVVNADTGEQLVGLSRGDQDGLPPGSYILAFPNFTSPALSIEDGKDYVVAAADYGLATVRLDDTTIGGIEIFFQESGERLLGMQGTNPQQIPPDTYRLKFANLEASGYVVAPNGDYIISASDFGVAEITLAETVLGSNVQVFDDVTGARIAGIVPGSSQQVPAGTYRFEFPNFTSPPVLLEGGESYTIAASDFGVAEVALADTVLGSSVQAHDDMTGERMFGMSGTRTQQVLAGTYRFKFQNFTSPAVVLEAGESYIIAASDYGVAEIALDDTGLTGNVQGYDDDSGERIFGMSGDRFQQVPAGTYRFHFQDYVSPSVVLEEGSRRTISMKDFGMATVSLVERVRDDFLLLQGGQEPINLKNGRERQIGPGPYAMLYQGVELGIVNIEPGETRVIEIE